MDVIERLREAIAYDTQTGRMVWRVSRGSRRVGDSAGHIESASGYVRLKFGGNLYIGHRVAWAITNGEWPVSDLDHINGNRSDNRIENLRLATRAENQMNRRQMKNNSSGQRGVSWHPVMNRWVARCSANGKRAHLGYFDSFDAAASAYQHAAQSMHGDFYRKGA